MWALNVWWYACMDRLWLDFSNVQFCQGSRMNSLLLFVTFSVSFLNWSFYNFVIWMINLGLKLFSHAISTGSICFFNVIFIMYGIFVSFCNIDFLSYICTIVDICLYQNVWYWIFNFISAYLHNLRVWKVHCKLLIFIILKTPAHRAANGIISTSQKVALPAAQPSNNSTDSNSNPVLQQTEMLSTINKLLQQAQEVT